MFSQTLFLILIKFNMIGHHHLRPVRHFDLRHRNSFFHNRLNLLKQYRDIQRHTVSDHAGSMVVKHTGRKGMKCEFPVIIYNRMTCIGATLKSDNNI